MELSEEKKITKQISRLTTTTEIIAFVSSLFGTLRTAKKVAMAGGAMSFAAGSRSWKIPDFHQSTTWETTKRTKFQKMSQS
mmetsp:Transcript_12277/g.16400  ORF Transcript_12277/g.16400 Transcript_12277/m.16400 type:complete len:81 (+) Transcript_12277:302-544(+)